MFEMLRVMQMGKRDLMARMSSLDAAGMDGPTNGLLPRPLEPRQTRASFQGRGAGEPAMEGAAEVLACARGRPTTEQPMQSA